MAQLDSIIDNTNVQQDIELSSAIRAMQANPSEFQNYVNSQFDKVYKDITTQKNSTLDKVYSDLYRGSTVEEAILMHNKRAKQIASLQQQIYDNQERSATATTHDRDIAMRKNEMNEWSVGNKQDTLFVLSSLFLMLSGFLLITGLLRMGVISSSLWMAFAIPLLIIFLLILVVRWRYTEVWRNKRYWNKKDFLAKKDKIQFPTCDSLTAGMATVGDAASAAAAAATGAVTGAIGAGGMGGAMGAGTVGAGGAGGVGGATA